LFRKLNKIWILENNMDYLSKLIDWLKKLFLKKEKREYKEILKPEIKEERKYREILEQEIKQERKPKLKLEVYPREITKKEKFERLINNIEVNRDTLVKERLKDRLKIKQEGSWVRIFFNQRIFLVDEEGLKVFNEEFNIPDYHLCLVYSKNGVYLAREKNYGKEELFHRFLMKKEIEDFQLERGCRFESIVVHHINFEEYDNRRENLKVMTKQEHDKIHNRRLNKIE
jgi:hypothetical protein